MSVSHPLPAAPKQLLPTEAYTSQAWLEMEKAHLFSDTWLYAGVVGDYPENGYYRTIQAGSYSLIVLRNQQGDLQAFHNICRHRGTELLEGEGQLKNTIVCPYHRWSFGLDGTLRGVPNQSECFPNLDKRENGLLEASIGVFKGIVFVHPQAKPSMSFDAWLASLPDVAWPFDFETDGLVPSEEITYEMKCNWKVFYENAIDGYHLAYLHENTLGPLYPNANVWVEHGQHLVWYSTERDGQRHALPTLVEDQLNQFRVKPFKDMPTDFGGVYMFFPTTIVTPNPYGVSISQLVPVAPGITHLKARSWAPKGRKGRLSADVKSIPGYDKARGVITSDNWKKHPLETLDFQTEDVWVCEKQQRAMESPNFAIQHLAAGAGAESTIEHFQRCLLDYVPDSTRVAAE